MTNVGDILRINGCQSMFGQQICNTFYYVVGLWTGNSSLSDVANAFTTEVIVPLKTVQSSSLTWDTIQIDNITNGVEFYERAIDIQGDGQGSPALPSYVALTAKLGRSSKITRNGSKRIAGLKEDDVSGNDVVLSQGEIDNIIGALEVSLADGDPPANYEMSPVIVGRNSNGTYDLGRVNNVSSVQLNQFISTQNSRKQRTS